MQPVNYDLLLQNKKILKKNFEYTIGSQPVEKIVNCSMDTNTRNRALQCKTHPDEKMWLPAFKSIDQ